jgi:hypothetical protein
MDKSARISISTLVVSCLAVAFIALVRGYPDMAIAVGVGVVTGLAIFGAFVCYLAWYSWAFLDIDAIKRSRDEQRRTRFR